MGDWVKLIGDKELSLRMTLLGAKADRIAHDAAGYWAGDVTRSAQDRVPVKTGHLRDHINPSVQGVNAEVVADTRYARFVELGTGHGAAQPYLYPAFAEHRDVVPYVREALAEHLDL